MLHSLLIYYLNYEPILFLFASVLLMQRNCELNV